MISSEKPHMSRDPDRVISGYMAVPDWMQNEIKKASNIEDALKLFNTKPYYPSLEPLKPGSDQQFLEQLKTTVQKILTNQELSGLEHTIIQNSFKDSSK